MEIQVRTDSSVEGSTGMTAAIQGDVAAGLDHYASRITRVNVHLTDESGRREGEFDLQCMLEVRPAGHEPVVVHHRAATVEESTSGAIRQMRARLRSLFGRLGDDRGAGAETIRAPRM